jgi:hypothetical protein
MTYTQRNVKRVKHAPYTNTHARALPNQYKAIHSNTKQDAFSLTIRTEAPETRKHNQQDAKLVQLKKESGLPGVSPAGHLIQQNTIFDKLQQSTLNNILRYGGYCGSSENNVLQEFCTEK